MLRPWGSFEVVVGAMSILCGRHSTFCMLLKRWQAWLKMRGGFGAHVSWAQKLVNLEEFGQRKVLVFVKWSSFLFLDMMMIPCGRRSTSDASGSFSWQAQYFIDLCQKVPET